jgi:AraC-like DNA-binding protein/quercetin dioxygenase-like cupin family protein
MLKIRHPTPAPAPLVPRELARPLHGLAAEYAPGAQIPLHQHPFAQLLYASSGVMTVTTEHGTWVVPPERAVWVPARVGHAIRMTGHVSMRTLYLSDALGPLAGSACCVVQVSPLLRESILRAVGFANPYREDGPEARLVAVVVDEIRAAPTTPLHLPLPRDSRARRVADALCVDPGDPRTLADWARIAGASARTLERVFERETKLSFGAWRQQARLLRGLEQLASGETVTSVALELGYETPSSFIAMFRRALGTSPGRYFRASS